MAVTHRICPYSKATTGNIDVRLLTAERAQPDTV
jgi:organic hydroperoxide reductase OsmC/OhrA